MVRKIFILIICLFVCLGSYSQTNDSEYWEKTINAIVQVESEGKTHVVNGSCAGPMQISTILIAECNNILKKKKLKKRYSLSDRYSLSKSKEIFILIQQTYNKARNIEKAIRSWNGGINYSVSKTNKYYRKVMKWM